MKPYKYDKMEIIKDMSVRLILGFGIVSIEFGMSKNHLLDDLLNGFLG